ncbi:MAG: hypothetical protein Q9M97_01840 [Candidatus Gracilibacteria bacterium]|nr:hypothetical protein [Candidatus Gracilibacteria bacterium]
MVKYISINAIRKRISYFEEKGFVAVNKKSRLSGNGNLEMLFEI